MQNAEKKVTGRKPTITVDLTQAYNSPTLGEVLDQAHRVVYGNCAGYSERVTKFHREWMASRALRLVCEIIIRTGDQTLLMEGGRKRFLQQFPVQRPVAENVIPVDFRREPAA